jgi:hypothetical protein
VRTVAGDSTSAWPPNPASRCTAAASCSKVSVTSRHPWVSGGDAVASAVRTASPNTSPNDASASGDARSRTSTFGRLVTSAAGLHVLILPGPKRADLRRDGRYSLHTETFAPPREDDGFAVSGQAREETDRGTWNIVRDQVLADFGELWPNYDDLTLFELSVASCLLTLTQPSGLFPRGATIWKPPA